MTSAYLHRRNIFSREAVRCIWYKHTRLSNSSITHHNALNWAAVSHDANTQSGSTTTLKKHTILLFIHYNLLGAFVCVYVWLAILSSDRTVQIQPVLQFIVLMYEYILLFSGCFFAHSRLNKQGQALSIKEHSYAHAPDSDLRDKFSTQIPLLNFYLFI